MEIPQFVTVEMLLAIGLAAIGIFLVLDYSGHNRRRRRLYVPSTRYQVPNVQTIGPMAATSQLQHVMTANFTSKRIMSASEYKVFRIVEQEVAAIRAGHRTFAQTSLGEILRSDNHLAHSSINSKRVDILVVGHDGMPCFCVEYQGEGHYQSSAAARDAVKKEALRKAGVGYVEVMHTHSIQDIQNLIRSMLRSLSPSPSPAPEPQMR